jgi:hypothetical protein
VEASEVPAPAELPDRLRLVHPVGALESPSLVNNGTEIPAYELKFLLSESQARAVEELARQHLVPDPHGDPAAGNAYHTTSLYCDTAQLDVFHRCQGFKRRKHRLRRYGQENWLFLERKSKWGDRVKKRRSRIAEMELPLLSGPPSAEEWPGHWFQQQLRERALLPICRIAYERFALVGLSAAGPLRLTFDRRLRGELTNSWDLTSLKQGLAVLTDRVICEFKYPAFLPLVFKEIISNLCLTPSPVSKYRMFLRETGLFASS